MERFCNSYRLHHAVAIILGLTMTLVNATRVAAEPSVHQLLLEQLGPGQVKGVATAPVTMEEFSDFQCSYCAKFTRDTLGRLIETYVDTGKMRLVFRHFAILGPDSERAAEASACAGAQGQFWPYHDRLYAVQGRLSYTRNNLLRLAKELNLEITNFTTCLDSGRFVAQVRDESNAAMVLGLRGTPGFVINGRPLSGALPFDLFQSVIEEALAAAVPGK